MKRLIMGHSRLNCRQIGEISPSVVAFVHCTRSVVESIQPTSGRRSPMLDKAQRHDAGVRLTAQAREATRAAETLLAEATAAVRQRVTADGHMVDRLLDRQQRATHVLPLLATYSAAIRPLTAYSVRTHACDS